MEQFTPQQVAELERWADRMCPICKMVVCDHEVPVDPAHTEQDAGQYEQPTRPLDFSNDEPFDYECFRSDLA